MKHKDNTSRNSFSAFFTKILILPFIILMLGLILLMVTLVYCESFVEHSQFLEENSLHNHSEVYEFLVQNLAMQSANITSTQNFILENQLDCSAILRKTDTSCFTEIEFDSLIVCFIPAHLSNTIRGKLNVCYSNPHIRIIFLFEDEVLVHTFTEMLLTGL